MAVCFTNGVVLCEHYERLDGRFFATFIEKYLLGCSMERSTQEESICSGRWSNSAGKLINLPRERVNVVQFRILPQIPDCNPIEHFFNSVERKLQIDALEPNI